MKLIDLYKVKREDAAFLHALMNNQAIMNVLHELPTTIDVWKEAVAAWESDDDEEDYIICCGTVSVGWLGINGLASAEKKAFVKMLVVLPEYQGQGIGQYAMKKMLGILRSQGYVSVGLYTDCGNIRAQRCYLKCGFEIVGEQVKTMSDGSEVERCEMVCLL